MRAARVIPDGSNNRRINVRLGTLENLFEPDILLAATLGRVHADSPERQLMLAVFESAISTVLQPAAHTVADVTRDREWFESRADTYLYSFEQICQHFDLNASMIRAAVLRPRRASSGPNRAPRARTRARAMRAMA